MTHDEPKHIQTFLHDILTTIGNALHQHVDVVLESNLIIPNNLSLARNVILKWNDHLTDIKWCFLTSVIRYQQKENLVTKASKVGMFEEDKRSYLANNWLYFLNFWYLGWVEEEEKHVDKYFQSLSKSFILLISTVMIDAFADIGMNHLDELSLVLFVELKRNLFQAIYDQTKPIFFGLVFHQLIYFLDEKLCGWNLEVTIQIIC